MKHGVNVNPFPKTGFRFWFAFLFVSLFLINLTLPAWSENQQRARIGVKLFRAMLSADLDLANRVNAAGGLTVLFFYSKDRETAQGLAQLLEGDDPNKKNLIRDYPTHVDVVLTSGSLDSDRGTVAGIFITEKLDDATFAKVVTYAKNLKVILFSPFEADVDRGATGGVSIKAQVRPLINMASLNASEIHLKEFFLKVSYKK